MTRYDFLMLDFLRKITPEFMLRAYHKTRAACAALLYGFPARNMIVIGITGTKGKTSTGNFIWSVLTAGGYAAGLISSANFRIGFEEEPNARKMTMPDAFFIQKKLAEMYRRKIEVAVMEMTSEGMKYFRHTGIPVDIAIFTNLTPEHLRSHGNNFEKYKKAKAPLFREALQHAPRKLRGAEVPTTIIANTDSEYAAYYLSFPAAQKITFGMHADGAKKPDILAEGIASDAAGTSFCIAGSEQRANAYHIRIPGTFNVYNALPAVAVGRLLGISDERIRTGISSLSVIPGRMERIEEGQAPAVIVDYAHEPAGMAAALDAARSMTAPAGRVILLTGIIGGGRDSRVPLIRVAAQKADMLVITNEDPYKEDPVKLLEQLAQAAETAGKVRDRDLFAILDRREAIRKAISLGAKGDIVLISGKGAEETMMTASGPVPWNERQIVRELANEAAQAGATNI